MEHVPGPTLRELIAWAPFPAKTIADVGRQLAAGLAEVHRAGIVHRDVKPENVIVSEGGFVKILDFGLSKPVKRSKREASTKPRDGEGSLTLPGTILGTPQYMSPEQASGQRADFRADQFALGTLLYEMATGVCAFRRDTLPDTLAAVGEVTPSAPEKLQANVPRELRIVVERLLSKRPEDRYPGMEEVEDALETLHRSFGEGDLGHGGSGRSALEAVIGGISFQRSRTESPRGSSGASSSLRSGLRQP
jgi:serine/threonine-protein kinase